MMKKRKMGIIATTMLLALTVAMPTEAQTVLTLEDCLRQGVERNLGLTRRKIQTERSREAIGEARANLLPQINGFFNLGDSFDPQTTVALSKLQGVKAVTEMQQYSAQGGLQLQMPLYNQSLYTVVAIQKLLNELDHMQLDKAREDLMLQIARLYYLGQATAEQIKLTEENIGRLTALRDITKALSENGMVLQVDVQRVDINLKNLKVTCENAQNLLAQQLNTLRYLIDYPTQEEIALTPIALNDAPQVALTGVSEGLPELQMLRQQQTLSERQIALAKQGYLPSLTLTGNLGWTTFSDEMAGWLDGTTVYNKWYRNSGLALVLRVPIFDGFSKRQKVRQARLAGESARVSLEDTRKNLQSSYLNAVNDLTNSERNYKEQLENLQLAEQVYAVTADRYQEGLAGMTEVLQDEMSISQAQNAYVNAHYNYRAAALTLMKLTGTLEKLIK